MTDESIQTAMFWMLLVPASVSLWAIVGFSLYLIYWVFTDNEPKCHPLLPRIHLKGDSDD